MRVITAHGINDAYIQGLSLLANESVGRTSRYGNVYVLPEPVTTHYYNPLERVLFHPQRDANPTFHLLEALWMLTGRNDTSLMTYLVPRVAEFSDNGETFHGAYGHRWRHYAPDEPTEYSYSDQLDVIVRRLQVNPDDRRCIIQMWDPARDLGRTGVDIPCNIAAKVEIGVRDKLNMTVFNRSNDIILGCYGANIVQFSILLEYLAARIGVRVGWLEQVSTNFHAYTATWSKYWPLQLDRRSGRRVISCPLVRDAHTFDDECRGVIDTLTRLHIIGAAHTKGLRNRFFHKVVGPLMWAYEHYRDGSVTEAVTSLDSTIEEFGSIDWLVSAQEWMTRRLPKE
jgi:hypothetical protein